MREPIDSADLPYEQQDMLSRLHEADLRNQFDAVLRERELPLRMYRFELTGEPLEAHSASVPITVRDVPYEQQDMLSRLHEADLRNQFDAVLRERELPLRMYRFELTAESLETHSASVPIVAADIDYVPPPGGCYCCSRDTPDGPWVCYCC